MDSIQSLANFFDGNFHLAQHMDISPDGKYLAAGGYKDLNGVVVISLENNTAVFSALYEQMVECPIPSFSQDGKTLAVVLRSFEGPKNIIHLYNDRLEEIGKHPTGTSLVRIGKLFSDGSRLLTASSDAFCKVFDLDLVRAKYLPESGPKVIQGHDGSVNYIGLTHMPEVFLSSAEDFTTNQASGRTIFWDADTGSALTVKSMGTRRLNILDSFCGDDSTLFLKQDGLGVRYEGDPQRVIVVSFPTMERVTELPITDCNGEIQFAVFSEGGSRVIIALSEPTFEIRVWDIKSATEITRFPSTGLDQKGEHITAMKSLFGNILAVALADPFRIVLLDTSSGRVVFGMDCREPGAMCRSFEACDFSVIKSRCKVVIAGTVREDLHQPAGVIRVYDFAQRELKLSLVIPAHSGKANFCRVTADEQYILSVGGDSAVRLWDANDGAPICAFVDERPISYISVIKHPSLPLLQVLLGSSSGRMFVMRLVRTAADLLTETAHKASLAKVEALRESLDTSRLNVNPTEGQLALSPQDGGAVNLYIDGQLTCPIDEKVMYSQGWTTTSRTMSPNPTMRISDWQESVLGVPQVCTCCIVPIADGVADVATSYYCATIVPFAVGMSSA